MSHNQNPESEWPTQNHENSCEGGRYPGFDSGPNGGWHIIPCFAPAPARPNPEAPASSSCSCACAAVCVIVLIVPLSKLGWFRELERKSDNNALCGETFL